MSIDATHAATIGDAGYVFVSAEAMHARLGTAGADDPRWQRFAQSWQRMPVDGYMADGGRYRRRRHGVVAVTHDGLVIPQPRQPHYQSRDYNPLNGGIQRWFEAIEDAVMDNTVTREVLLMAANCFGTLAPEVRRWHVELHQFRIETDDGHDGQPTPEGVHRDGVDYALVMLVHRQNVASGITHIATPEGDELGSFTLSAPGDATLLDDRRVLHGVTPIRPLDAAQPAYRDALVVTFARQPPGAG